MAKGDNGLDGTGAKGDRGGPTAKNGGQAGTKGDSGLDGAAAKDSDRNVGGRPRDAAIDEAIILATRDRRVRDGYSRMTIGDIATDAGVTRPTLYRRWATKFDLVVD